MPSFYHAQLQCQGLGCSLFLGLCRRPNYHGKSIFLWWNDNVKGYVPNWMYVAYTIFWYEMSFL